MIIKEVTPSDFQEWFDLARELWPDYETDEMTDALTGIQQSPIESAFLLRNDQKLAIGFINLSLRYDYVPGATKRPVAYVEGVFVRADFRQQGYGRQLILHAEEWARYQGCSELASDVLLDNVASQAFHRHVGFDEAERVVSFIKSV
ncbi:aminoglycoside 6'-N-acetyltransferase [Fibrella forsythiae]|uniref:Aminoglycoside N(6')-acetyltransferase type 1 n=1 Tax=Fibrella forsythiae TaxID=2817061 RepID=A0ABS3JAM5_9BACT|nr:aminoglycoside 6'-N-acetyltransferase [Fibrella forsythiae]MBO0947045.1 GNAT family N-acetyltransferase [Fibrella forsythiae]